MKTIDKIDAQICSKYKQIHNRVVVVIKYESWKQIKAQILGHMKSYCIKNKTAHFFNFRQIYEHKGQNK